MVVFQVELGTAGQHSENRLHRGLDIVPRRLRRFDVDVQRFVPPSPVQLIHKSEHR